MKGKQKLVKGKPRRGEPRTEHEETKTRINMTLTPTAIASLDRIAAELEISRSELVERLARVEDAAIMELLRGERIP